MHAQRLVDSRRPHDAAYHCRDAALQACLSGTLDGVDGAGLQGAAQTLGERFGEMAAVVLGGLPDASVPGKVIPVACFRKDVTLSGLQAGKFIGGIAKICGGGGGGGPNLAQAGGRDGVASGGALQSAKQDLIAALSSS